MYPRIKFTESYNYHSTKAKFGLIYGENTFGVETNVCLRFINAVAIDAVIGVRTTSFSFDILLGVRFYSRGLL